MVAAIYAALYNPELITLNGGVDGGLLHTPSTLAADGVI
jgi:hypothetical protein